MRFSGAGLRMLACGLAQVEGTTAPGQRCWTRLRKFWAIGRLTRPVERNGEAL